jgi:hypothetical protein
LGFSIAVDAVVPPEIEVHPLPAEVQQLTPELRGFGYIVVEEQIAIIDRARGRSTWQFPNGANDVLDASAAEARAGQTFA